MTQTHTHTKLISKIIKTSQKARQSAIVCVHITNLSIGRMYPPHFNPLWDGIMHLFNGVSKENAGVTPPEVSCLQLAVFHNKEIHLQTSQTVNPSRKEELLQRKETQTQHSTGQLIDSVGRRDQQFLYTSTNVCVPWLSKKQAYTQHVHVPQCKPCRSSQSHCHIQLQVRKECIQSSTCVGNTCTFTVQWSCMPTTTNWMTVNILYILNVDVHQDTSTTFHFLTHIHTTR